MANGSVDLDAALDVMGLASAEADASHAGRYRDMAGFVPARVAARLAISGRLDPEMVELQEVARARALSAPCFDDKTVQLMVFGMLMVELSDAAFVHGLAARRAGASWAELQAVLNLAYLFRGIPAANRGAEILARMAEREGAARTADGA